MERGTRPLRSLGTRAAEGVWEEDGLALVREDTAAHVRVEDGVKWRLNIRKHFPALARIWAAEPAPRTSCEPPLQGQAAAQQGLATGTPIRAPCLPHHHSWGFPSPFLPP